MNHEHQIINLIKQTIQSSTQYIGDDCAVIDNPRAQSLVSSDAMVEDIHFTQDIPPHTLGYKIAAVNISDIIAMGGIPQYFSLTMSLPSYDLSWMELFLQGLQDCLSKYNTALIGGDLTGSTDKLILSGHIIGYTNTHNIIAKRNQAQVNDNIIISGNIGHSSLGLYALQNNQDNYKSYIHNHYYPELQFKQAQDLIHKYQCQCMMDISDGLLDCIQQISQQSNVSMSVTLDQLIKLLPDIHTPEAFILSGGEDYSIFGTIPSHIDITDTPYICIGKVTPPAQQSQIYINNNLLDLQIYQEHQYKHFQ